MGFRDLVGNARVIAVLQRMLARDRIPAALLFAGQKGVGKYTLATTLARAALCQKSEGDFCSRCENCLTLAALDDLPALVEAAREARGRSDPEEVPLLIQPHPDVTVVVPDPTYIRMSQMRAVRRLAYTAPARARRFILLDDAERLRADFAGTLLKVLEEPPASTYFILISHAPYELPVTIRSRTVSLHFAPLAAEAIESYLAKKRPDLSQKDRALAASAAAGSLGRALSLDVEQYRDVRHQALNFLATTPGEEFDPAELFAATAQLAGRGRSTADETAAPGGGRAAFEFSLEVLYSVTRDVLYLKAQASDLGLHNPDVRSELERLSRRVGWQWVTEKVGGLDRIEHGLRRNINRQLGLDAVALGQQAGELGETPEPAGASE